MNSMDGRIGMVPRVLFVLLFSQNTIENDRFENGIIVNR